MSDVYLALEPGAKAPERASDDAAGYDLFALHDVAILPGQTQLVSTGVRLAIPPGYEAQVRPRSGISLRTHLRVANSPGTIDADYRGIVSVICENTVSLTDPLAYLLRRPELLEAFNHMYRSVRAGEYLRLKQDIVLPFGLPDTTIYLDKDNYPLGTIFIKAGERIAQLIFARIELPDLVLIDDVTTIGSDRGGGFGSTGRR